MVFPAKSSSCSIDIVDDVLIVLGDVVLDVDNDKCPVVHHSSRMKLRG